jgi:hypothetical protein
MADIDLKTLTPDTSLPTTGFLFGADSQATASPSVYSTQTVATTLLGSTSLTGDTLTADAPVLNLAQTWNNVAVTFTGMKFNATDTTSAAASLLMDLGTGGGTFVSKFSVSKFGTVTASENTTANTLALRNSTTAQAFRVYKTYTDASNYERGVFDWTTTANQLTIGTQKLGSGTARPLELQTDGTAVLTLATDGSVTQSGTYFKLINRLATCQVWIGSESVVSAFIGTITNTPFAFRANNTAWLTISTAGLLQLHGTTSAFPALKRSTTFLQARLADDSAFTNIQGKLTTDTNATVGTITPDKYLVLYDATGTAYRIPAVLN